MKEDCKNCRYKNRGSLRYPCDTGVYQLYCSHRCFMWKKRTWWQRLFDKKGGQYVCNILNTYNRERLEWIPVTERLPELDTDVLVAVYDFGEDTSTLLDCLVESNGKSMWSTFNRATEQVLAWMPLPEPYRLSNKGDDE